MEINEISSSFFSDLTSGVILEGKSEVQSSSFVSYTESKAQYERRKEVLQRHNLFIEPKKISPRVGPILHKKGGSQHVKLYLLCMFLFLFYLVKTGILSCYFSCLSLRDPGRVPLHLSVSSLSCTVQVQSTGPQLEWCNKVLVGY